MLNKQYDAFMACEAEAEAPETRTVMFGAPFDSSTSYRPGTRFGSAKIRRESYGVETYSPYQDLDLEDYAIADVGDLELSFGDAKAALASIEACAREILALGKRPFMLGGEHLVTLGAFRAAAEAYPDLLMIHFDAHADLRDDYLGVRLSHACVIRRCLEEKPGMPLYQFGIRSGTREEFALAASSADIRQQRFNFDGLEAIVEAAGQRPVYLTIDLDVLDPSVFPGTGTPESGGVSFDALREAVTMVCRRTRVIALDVNELSPPYDPSGISAAAACKLVRELLLALEYRDSMNA